MINIENVHNIQHIVYKTSLDTFIKVDNSEGARVIDFEEKECLPRKVKPDKRFFWVAMEIEGAKVFNYKFGRDYSCLKKGSYWRCDSLPLWEQCQILKELTLNDEQFEYGGSSKNHSNRWEILAEFAEYQMSTELGHFLTDLIYQASYQAKHRDLLDMVQKMGRVGSMALGSVGYVTSWIMPRWLHTYLVDEIDKKEKDIKRRQGYVQYPLSDFYRQYVVDYQKAQHKYPEMAECKPPW